MNFNFNTLDFKEQLTKISAEILKITSNDVQETDQFKALHSGLISYLKEFPMSEFKLLLISKDALSILKEDFYNNLKSQLNSDDGINNNYLIIDNEANIINKTRDYSLKDSAVAQKVFEKLSEKNIVFLLQPKGLIRYFIDGNSFGKGVFYTYDDYISYEEKRDISKINEVFDEYRKHLKLQNIYCKFFIKNSHLKSLHKDLGSKLSEKEFLTSYKHVLNNKPEELFRDDLKHFLEQKLKVILLAKEYILENFKRLDIYLQDESGFNLYLIEVKWVGQSIHGEGKKWGTKYDAININPAAVKQSVNYIKQLDEQEKPIKIGYLVVFDARKDDLEDTIPASQLQEILSEEDSRYSFRFRKINDFRVVNNHPK